jgi:hypothetical protein
MESQRLSPLGRVLAALGAGALTALAIFAVARGGRVSSIASLAFLIAFLTYAAATGRWLWFFGRPSR